MISFLLYICFFFFLISAERSMDALNILYHTQIKSYNKNIIKIHSENCWYNVWIDTKITNMIAIMCVKTGLNCIFHYSHCLFNIYTASTGHFVKIYSVMWHCSGRKTLILPWQFKHNDSEKSTIPIGWTV